MPVPLRVGNPSPDYPWPWTVAPYPPGAPAGGPPVDGALRRRARGWALSLAVMLLAHSADNPQLRGIGARTLAAVLADQP